MENIKNEESITFKPAYSGLKAELISSLFLIVIGILIYFLPKPIEITRYVRKFTDKNTIYLVLSTLFCLFGIFKFLKLKIYINSHTYILNKQRLTCKTGFLSKKVSNLELWRVLDVELKQSFTEYSTGGCTIVLTTQDLSDPILNIKGLNIKDGKSIYDVIANYVAYATKNSGITRMA